MQVNVQKLLKDCGLEESLYPGKRIVSKMPQQGKSHCVVYDWRTPETLRLDIKAGLTGKNLTKRELAKFPVSFQSPTFVEIDTHYSANENASAEDEDGEDETSGSSGKGGGGRGLKRRPSLAAFSQVVEGRIPNLGEVKRLVVMGKEIAKEAFKTVLESLTAQIRTMSFAPVNILAAAGAVKTTVATPGGRSLNEIPQGLVSNADVKYKPKDMFGVNPS